MDFPTIQTNFWDAVIAIPAVMGVTQIIKVSFKPPNALIPTIALVVGLILSIFVSHRGDLLAGALMGWFYEYAAVGSYASLKTSFVSFLQTNHKPNIT